MDSSIVLWDLQRMEIEWRFSVPSTTECMNSVMAVDVSPYMKRMATVTREGCVALLDTSSSSPITSYVLLTQFLAHSSKTNHIEVSRSETHILTSARDNSIKLWDLRKCGPNLPPLMAYTGHKCVMYPIPGRLYMDERFVLTGDDESGVVVYDTCSGKVVKKMPMDSGVALTEPMDTSSPDFYCVFVQQQKLAIMQTSGESVVTSVPSAQDIQTEKVKNAMQKAIWKYNERIFHHLKAIGKFNMVGYGSLLEVLQREAANDEECRRIITAVRTTQINDQYAIYLHEAMSEQEQANSAHVEEHVEQRKSRRPASTSRTEVAPRVRVEKETRAR